MEKSGVQDYEYVEKKQTKKVHESKESFIDLKKKKNGIGMNTMTAHYST